MRKTKKQRFRASILAFLLIASMVLGMVPGSAGQVYAKESTSSPSEEEPGLIDKAVDFFQNTGDKIASYFGAGGEAQPAAAFDETSVVDAETSQGWQTLVKKTTQNIGRIWTDKSVYNSNVTLPGIGEGGQEIPITKPEGSDFMVGLSALSSTSNTSVTTSTPLDIVLVLDVSGSMKNNLGTTYVYEEAYTISTTEETTYYAIDKQTGAYVKVDRVTREDWWNSQFVHWELNGETVEPKNDPNDNNPDHIQFYTQQRVTLTKMEGLTNAVNGFIDATADQNALIADPAKQHQISIVKYAGNISNSVGNDTYYEGRYEWNYSQIVSDLTNNTTSLKNAVDNLRAVGGTAADNGMQLANTVLTAEEHGARPNAQKIVVMFTDGEPTEGNDQSFNSAVATRAIQNAKTLKDAKALVYTIGVLNGANPDANINTDTEDNINAYLHSVSSNYPKAEGYEGGWYGAGWIMGDRAENSNYYKAATNSEELNNIFQEISEEINTGTGYPTETKDGYANTSGYVTFRDQLGDYMQVDSFNTLVLEDIIFNKVKKTEDGGVITYTYEGSAGKNKEVSDIVIKVTPGTGSKGDTVDVSIPASLLPLRHFKVDVSGNKMTVEDKYPLRLFYNVSLKEYAKKALANPDQDMKNYIDNNAADGKVYFYSNKFTGSKQGPTEGQTLGDTTATFKPATGNSFYYFTENTMLWLDEQKNQPAKSYSAEQGHDTYYYEKTYYELVNGEPKEVTEMVSFRSHPRDEVEGWVGTAADGQLYIKAGAPRLTRIYDLTASKGKDAVPGTATEVITPNWDNKQAQRNIEVSLGNNGRLAVELPGTLEIKKTVTSEVEAPKNKEFTFKLTLKNKEGKALTGEFEAQKFDAQGAKSGGPVKVQNNSTVTLKDGESVKIYGLSDGDTYSIEEKEIPRGFTAEVNTIEGTIKGNETVTAAFKNTYAVTPAVLEGDSSIRAKKTLTGRDWLDTDSFNIALTSIENAPLPEASEGITIEGNRAIKTVTKGDKDAPDAFDFGKITFTKPGTYVYNVAESAPTPDKEIPGINYSGAVYRVDVVVTDNGEGVLSATSTMTQVWDEMGHAIEGGGTTIDDGVASFTNTYATTQNATFTPSVVKKVEGLNAKENFTFKLSADDEATKQAIDDATITGIGTMADPYSAEKTTLTLIQKGKTEQVDFNALTFKKAGTYKFTVKETNTNVPTGWTYDGHTYKITINVTDVASVLKAQMGITDPNTNSQIFTNSFKATTTYGEEGGLNVTKTLNGRTLKADMFNFTITGKATDSVTAEEANAKLENTDKNFKNTAPGEDSVAVMSKLSAVKFDETDIGKTYQYAVQEIPGTDPKYTYDNVSATVAIQVLEKDGGLYTVTTVTKGEDVKTYSSTNGKATAVAPFVNSYTPEIVNVDPGTFGGNVTKVLKGNRGTELAADEFNFQMTITPADETSSMEGVVLPEGANNGTVTAANTANGLVSFGNIQFRAAGTYHVEISEVIPEKKDPNMTYDKHTFSYDIEVTYDASKGELSVKAVEDSKSGSPVFTNIYEADDAKDVANTDESTTSVDGKIVGVGDQLTYTIDWVNNAVDETTGAPAKAEVTITDIVPAGTKYVSAGNEGAYDEGTNTITWTLGEQEAGASGTVSFVVEVLDNAGGTDVTNKAEITVGNNDPKKTNEVTTKVPGKDSVVEGDGELQVGKILTYTISYKNPEEEAATVTIKDIIPEGLDYVDGSASDGATYNKEDRTLTWMLADVQPGTEGTVTFDAKVNESAKTVIDNKATIQIGDNAPTYDTNTDQNEIPKDGNLAISKTIALAEDQDTEINKEQTFTFTVALKDAKGAALTKEYAYTVTDGDQKTAEGKIANAGTISLKHGQKATITGLPAGAQYKVTETEAAGYTADASVKEGTVAAEKTANADFTNTYSVAGSLSGSDALTVTKKLVGREWLDTDTFKYQLTAADEATKKAVEGRFITLPDNAGSLEITKESAKHQAAFGDIQFTIAGTFKFHVTEQPSGIAGITDDKNAERTVVVKVTDKKDGTLDIAIVKDESENLTFTNTYGAGTGEVDIAAQIPATKKLTGRDMKTEEFQFEVVTRKADEAAEGFKEEVVAVGTNGEAANSTPGAVTFVGKDNVKLTYTVESLNQAVTNGYAVKEVQNGQNVWTVSYTARELTKNLPGGVKAVEEKTSYDFTIVVTDHNDGTLTTAVQIPKGGIAFENIYTTGGTEVDTDPTDAAAYFNKVLTGRDWLESDEFTFTIVPQGDAPAPEGAANDGTKTVSVTSNSAKAGESVPFGFGKIPFTDADMAGATTNEDGTLSKTFTYQITENDVNEEAMPGVTIDTRVAKLKITVTDNLQGELSVATAAITVENGTFTNMYESSLDYTAVGGLQITKVLNGRDMEAGQFTFTVTPEDKDSADKLGLAEGATEFTNTAKAAGEVDTIDVLAGKNVIFTQADAGKTFIYTVAEKEGDNSAYTYDNTPRTVTIEVKDNKNATLTVTTTVKKGSEVVDIQSVTTGGKDQKKATVAFENTYNANPTTLGGEGNVKINAKKSLTNRPMVAGEFTFNVKDKNQNPVTSGANSADGTITFAPVKYDADKLIADEKAGIAKKSVQEGAYVYTYDYTVVEAPTTDGVTGDATTFAIQVIVTDKGDGTLELKVQYPEGTDSLAFKNLYGEGAEAEITINGHKQYEVASGDNEPDITGKYTFTITGSKGAPMPEKTEVTNDAAGNVTFGAITYTMENVFGDTGSKPEVAEAAEGAAEDEAEGDEKDLTEAKSAKREKTFTYTVAESGSVPGVQNDGSSKTFTVKVTDNGNGTIAVEKSWKENEFPFSFTNTYSVTPADYSINTDLTITKELDGRELREGEFTFEMVGEGETVLQEAVNAKDGSVTFGALTYEKPGTYNYVIREQKGSAGGVEYDSAEHTVVVVVTDNGNGTMTAKAELKSRDGEDAKNAKNAIVFKNSYTAQPASVTLGASKAYVGGELKDGQFTFELKDKDGKVVSKAKNTKEGQIVFETISYDQAGTYEYKISEVNDEQKHVTYDKTVYGVTVTVTDNQEGSLMAAVEYDGGKAPVFTNKYSKPAKPAKPEEPKGPTAVKTGDEAPVIPFIILMVATLAIIVTITFIFFRRKRR